LISLLNGKYNCHQFCFKCNPFKYEIPPGNECKLMYGEKYCIWIIWILALICNALFAFFATMAGNVAINRPCVSVFIFGCCCI
jgi:hypothetical protein